MTAQQDAAKTIFAQLLAHGVSRGVAAGILGNAQAESGIIADRWEGDNPSNKAGGYGLLQWTPSSKLIDWANGQHQNPAALQTQINRILWEIQTGTQFYKAGTTFSAWAASNITPEQAADDFVRYYERPAVVNSGTRQAFARQWYNYLAGTGASSAPAAPAQAKNKDGSLTLTVDGVRGPATVARWQEVMATPIDGKVDATGSALIKADQTFLNSTLQAADLKNLVGGKLVVDGTEGAKTIKARQYWLFNLHAEAVLHRKAALSDFDGKLGPNTNKLHQVALNAATAHSKKY